VLLGRSRKLEKDEAVYMQGDRADSFFVVLEGAALFQRHDAGAAPPAHFQGPFSNPCEFQDPFETPVEI
jgi:hypothetical protein